MNYIDYYKVLGVAKNATTDEIKKAYRKLAVKYHPDKTKGNKTDNARFMEINDANQVLSNPEKRKKYDQFGEDWKQHEEAGAQQSGFDWSKYARPDNARQQSATANENGSIFTEDNNDDLFEMLFGERSGRVRRGRSTVQKGEDLNAETTLTLEEAYHGTSRFIQLDGQTIKVTIPHGIADGQILRIAKKGMAGWNGGPKGDLYLTVKLAQHLVFNRTGNDLACTLPVDIYTAILGGKTLVTTMKGAVKVDVQKETTNHKVLRLRGLGMPVFGKKDTFGNLFVTIDVRLPDHLTEQETELFRKLAKLRKSVP